MLWHQLCDKASESRKPIILITDDQKEDWIWRIRGQTLGPRPELVAEMSQKAEVGFHIYTPLGFLEQWNGWAGGAALKREVIDEIQALAVDAPEIQNRNLQISTKWVRRLDGPEAGAESLQQNQARRGSLEARQELANPEYRAYGASVELTITREPDPPVPSGSAVQVSVTDPRGQTAIVQFRSVDLGVPYWHQLTVRYPDDFRDAEALRTGRYFVVWRETGIPLADYVEALELGHTTFTVRLRARQGRVSHEIS